MKRMTMQIGKYTVLLLLLCVSAVFARRAPEIDHFILSDLTTWQDCETVYILPFKIEETEKLSSDEQFYARLFVQNLRFALSKSGLFDKIELLSDSSTIPEDGIVITGVLNKLDGGSENARILIGFGAGSSWCKVSLELFHQKTNTVVAFARHKTRSGGGSPHEIMMKTTEEAAKNIAKVLIHYKKD